MKFSKSPVTKNISILWSLGSALRGKDISNKLWNLTPQNMDKRPENSTPKCATLVYQLL
jgi:hypothetical protein